MALDRCYWDDWDWEILDPETPETTGSTGTSGAPSSGCPPEEDCDRFFKPKIDTFLLIPTSIIEIYYET